MTIKPLSLAAAFAVLALSACATGPRSTSQVNPMFEPMRITEHRQDDDLLTAGLGMAGLRAMTAPAFADVEQPTPAEVRRRAVWNNWRGIADLAPGGGYGELYGSTANVPGREFSALATLPGAMQPHRVLVQVPDDFDMDKRCLLVAPSSGSRGVYGAISVAGAWGLPKGCAVAYTDKGAGTDYFDLDAGQGIGLDGTPAEAGEALAFGPDLGASAAGSVRGVAIKHAHSGDNPEADWGRHVQQAAEFALHALQSAFPKAAPFTFDNTRVIAVGISNGGGAVLRAAELPGEWLDAVVAGEPSILVPKGRSLMEYSIEAALLMPCALLDPALAPLPQPPGMMAQVTPMWTQRCASLKAAGLVEGDDVAAQSRSAHAQLQAGGWTPEAIRAAALSTGFDLWRAVAVTYASAYGRYGIEDHRCGYSFAAQNPDGSPRAATAAERAAWPGDASGIAPGAGVGIIDGMAAGPDPAFPGLQCLRELATRDEPDPMRVRAGFEETSGDNPPRQGLPVFVIHGLDDGLVPAAFNSTPYIAIAKAAGRDVRYWQVRNAQHFDAFLGLPDYAARYVPMLPYVYAALDRVAAYLDNGVALPGDAIIATTPRGPDTALSALHLQIPGN
ncbi:MAG: hydrogenase [Lysobacter sp.]|nr:hydrogenase [Lysobacter sp.]